ncbi:MAG: hypothetical protein DRO18_05645 [Thermoprotei archaeon]|nr:MAG: hypothetical protein DRO18_05645 [Thermoprotei archaeon]
MPSYDEVKNSIINLKQQVLKYLYAETVKRRHNVFKEAKSRIQSAMDQINPLIGASIHELALGMIIERYLTTKANQIGKKYIGFNYNDQTVNMTGLDGNTYDNPTFPQIQLTQEEINTLNEAMKNVPIHLRKGICLVRVKSEDIANMPRPPDLEDNLYGYYVAEKVDYVIGYSTTFYAMVNADVTVFQFVYQAIDPLFNTLVTIKLDKLEGDVIDLFWFYNEETDMYDLYISVFYKPKIEYYDPDNPDNKRKTTAMFVLDVYNKLNVDGTIIVDRFEAPLKANKRLIVIIGSELTGLRGVEIAYEADIA